MTLLEQRRLASRRFGWISLLLWAIAGLGLEAMHGWKVGEYLDDDLTRELLVLAHAHGVGLSLVVLAWGEAGAPLFAERADGGASITLRIGAAMIPLAFALSSFDHPEGDPNAFVWLVPIGALLVIFALACTAAAALRRVV